MPSHSSNCGTYDRFLAYRAAIMQAIALAWRDPEFRIRLLKDPRSALKRSIGYEIPFNIDVTVHENSAVWDPDKASDWVVLKPEKLKLVLPPAPADKKEWIEALAAFNAKHLTFLS